MAIRAKNPSPAFVAGRLLSRTSDFLAMLAAGQVDKLEQSVAQEGTLWAKLPEGGFLAVDTKNSKIEVVKDTQTTPTTEFLEGADGIKLMEEVTRTVLKWINET
jgi:hypothetical protein